MIIYRPLFGDIKVPDNKKEIINLLHIATNMINQKYSTKTQAYIDTFNEALDTFRIKEGE